MTEEKREKILALLSKLQGLALDQTSPEESALAAARMQEIATRYNIELAELDTYDPEDLPEIIEGTCYTEKGVQIQTWKVWLAEAIARNNSCIIVTSKGHKRSGRKGKVIIVGNVDNSRIVTYMFAAISQAIESACRWHMRAGYGKGKRWSNSFKIGAVIEVEDRLYEATQAARETATSTALVRVDSEAERVDDWVDENMDLCNGPARGAKIGDAEGLALGKQTGRKVDLGGSDGGALGSGRKSLPR